MEKDEQEGPEAESVQFGAMKPQRPGPVKARRVLPD
jgi:hypothetical protein